MTKRTILMTAGEDIIVRNIFLSDFLGGFKRAAHEHSWEVVIATAPDLVERVQSIVGDFARVMPYKRARASRSESLVMSLARSSINSHTNLWSKMRSYRRGDSGMIATFTKRLLTMLVGNSSLWKRWLRRRILRLPPDPAARTLFDEVRPDIFVPLSLTNFEFDVPLAHAARARGIPIVGMVRSWDNLSSHGLLRVLPDVFILQNTFLSDMASKYQAIDTQTTQIRIAGLPHYDRYLREKAPIPRSELCSMLGLDPNKKLYVYGAMGEFLFTAERDMPQVLEDAVRKSGREDVQILFRAHPRFVPECGYGQFDHVVVHIPKSYTESSTYSNEDVLFSTIAHADLVITGASTFAIDAIVIGRPVVCITFDGARTVDYWMSAERFFDTYTHFEEFVKTSRVQLVRSAPELAEMLREPRGVENVDRKATLARFIGPPDGQAGKRLASLISESIENQLAPHSGDSA